jgi:hypothetical protein
MGTSAGGPAVGQWVDKLPSDFQPVEMNGFVYYQFKNQYYVQRDGKFVSVGPPTSVIREKRSISYRRF